MEPPSVVDDALDGPAPDPWVAVREISALADRYRRGEADALVTLHGRLSPAIGRVLARYHRLGLPPSLTAQDLSQQTWIILAELAQRWRPDGSFLAYFLQSFPREVQRFYQRALPTRRTRSVEVRVLPHDMLLAQLERRIDGGSLAEEPGALTDALRALPAPLRVALALRAVEGADFEAIGQILGVSRATAHRLYLRAVAALAGSVLAGRGGGGDRDGLASGHGVSGLPEVPGRGH